eukprot:scaffold435167_cov39-Prasinocladus_malaysianus.AAC.1
MAVISLLKQRCSQHLPTLGQSSVKTDSCSARTHLLCTYGRVAYNSGRIRAYTLLPSEQTFAPSYLRPLKLRIYRSDFAAHLS